MDIYQNPSMTVVFWLYSDYDERYLRYSEEAGEYYFVADDVLVAEGRSLTDEAKETYFEIFNDSFFMGTYKWSLSGLERINVQVNNTCIIGPSCYATVDDHNVVNEESNNTMHIIHVLERKETLVLELPSAILQRFSKNTKYDYLGIHGGLAYIPIIFGSITVYILEHVIGEIDAYGRVTDSYDTVIFYGPNDHIINILLDIELGLPDDIPEAIYKHSGTFGNIDYDTIVTAGLSKNWLLETDNQKRIATLSDVTIVCSAD